MDGQTAATQAAPAAPIPQPAEAKAPVATPGAGDASASAEAASALQGTPKEFYRIKVNGKEETLTHDEVITLAQKGRGADEKFRAATELRRQAEALIKRMKSGDVFGVAAELGLDPDELAKQRLVSYYQEQGLTPEEKKQRDTERRLKEYEAREAETKAQEEARQLQEKTERYRSQFAKTFEDALVKAKLPANATTISRMAKAQAAALRLGVDLTPRQLAEHVKKGIQDDMQVASKGSGPEALEALVGAEALDAYRKWKLEALSTKEKTESHRGAATIDLKPKKAKGKMSQDEWRAYLKG